MKMEILENYLDYKYIHTIREGMAKLQTDFLVALWTLGNGWKFGWTDPMLKVKLDMCPKKWRGKERIQLHTNFLIYASCPFWCASPWWVILINIYIYILGCTDTPFLASCQCRTPERVRLAGFRCPTSVLFFFLVSPTQLCRGFDASDMPAVKKKRKFRHISGHFGRNENFVRYKILTEKK